MKRLVIFQLLFLVVVAALPTAAQLPQVHVPVPSGWSVVDQEYRYGRDSLWEYINGAAELFLDYDFQELVVADFEQGDTGLTVCLYDMGTSLDAFGIFEAERPANAQELSDVGTAALLQPPYRGLVIKDRFYVKLEAGGGDLTAEALAGAMRDVATDLPGKTGLPPELAILPTEDRVAGTLAFAGSNYLGFEDLSGCLHADYKDAEGHEYGLFVMTPDRDFLEGASGKWTKSTHQGRLVFTRTIPYRGVVVLMGDHDLLLGVSGFEEADAAVALLTARMP